MPWDQEAEDLFDLAEELCDRESLSAALLRAMDGSTDYTNFTRDENG